MRNFRRFFAIIRRHNDNGSLDIDIVRDFDEISTKYHMNDLKYCTAKIGLQSFPTSLSSNYFLENWSQNFNKNLFYKLMFNWSTAFLNLQGIFYSRPLSKVLSQNNLIIQAYMMTRMIEKKRIKILRKTLFEWQIKCVQIQINLEL